MKLPCPADAFWEEGIILASLGDSAISPSIRAAVEPYSLTIETARPRLVDILVPDDGTLKSWGPNGLEAETATGMLKVMIRHDAAQLVLAGSLPEGALVNVRFADDLHSQTQGAVQECRDAEAGDLVLARTEDKRFALVWMSGVPEYDWDDQLKAAHRVVKVAMERA